MNPPEKEQVEVPDEAVKLAQRATGSTDEWCRLALRAAAPVLCAQERERLGAEWSDEDLDRLGGELEDVVRRAYCKPVIPPKEGENPETVDSMAVAALISDPGRMRHLAGIQNAVLAAFRKLFGAASLAAIRDQAAQHWGALQATGDNLTQHHSGTTNTSLSGDAEELLLEEREAERKAQDATVHALRQIHDEASHHLSHFTTDTPLGGFAQDVRRLAEEGLNGTGNSGDVEELGEGGRRWTIHLIDRGKGVAPWSGVRGPATNPPEDRNLSGVEWVKASEVEVIPASILDGLEDRIAVELHRAVALEDEDGPVEDSHYDEVARNVVSALLTQQSSTTGNSLSGEPGDREPEADEWCCDSCGRIAPEDSAGWEKTPTDDAGVSVERCPHCRLRSPWQSCRGSKEIYVGSGGGYGSPGSSYAPCGGCPDCRTVAPTATPPKDTHLSGDAFAEIDAEEFRETAGSPEAKALHRAADAHLARLRDEGRIDKPDLSGDGERLKAQFFDALDAQVRERQKEWRAEGTPTIFLADVQAALDTFLATRQPPENSSGETDRQRADRLEIECAELEDANRSLAKMRDAALEGNLAVADKAPAENSSGVEEGWHEVWVWRDSITGKLHSTTGSTELTPIPPVEGVREGARLYRTAAPTQPDSTTRLSEETEDDWTIIRRKVCGEQMREYDHSNLGCSCKGWGSDVETDDDLGTFDEARHEIVKVVAVSRLSMEGGEDGLRERLLSQAAKAVDRQTFMAVEGIVDAVLPATTQKPQDEEER